MLWTLLGYILDLENIVPFDSEDAAICFRRGRVEVINSSTWGCQKEVYQPLPY
jgi:hypothetical protein